MLRPQVCSMRLSCRRAIVTFLLILINLSVDLESEYIAEKPTNRAFQRHVCRREMLTSFRIRIGNILPSAGICHSENGEQKPLNISPSPCTTWTPSNTAMPRLTARTIPNRSSDGWGTVAHVRRKVPIAYNGAPEIRPKSTLSVGRSPNPTTCLIPGPVRPMMPNGIRIQSAFFHNALDRPTDGRTNSLTYVQTDRSSTRKFDDYSRYSFYESDAA